MPSPPAPPAAPVDQVEPEEPSYPWEQQRPPGQRILAQDQAPPGEEHSGEAPEISYHDIREQDEDGNFVYTDEEEQKGSFNQVDQVQQPSPQQQQDYSQRKEGRWLPQATPQQKRHKPAPAPPSFLTIAQWETVNKALVKKIWRIAADICKVC